MEEINIKIDYTEYPGLRHCNVSDDSGEDFYHKILNEKFKKCYDKKEKLCVNLDNTGGFASSFLDEAFGNLVYDFSLKVVKEYIEIKSFDEPHWKKMIEEETFIEWEERRIQRKEPKVTEIHPEWYRLEGNSIQKQIWNTPS